MGAENGGILQAPGYSLGGRGIAIAGGPPVRILQLDADIEQNPQTVVVSINATTQSPFGGSSDHRLQGLLRWGSKSGGCEALFDVRHGARVTLDASHVTLQVQLVSTSFFGGAITGSSRCIASIAYGSGASGMMLTLTLPPVFVPAGGVSAMIAIPGYAANVRFFSNALFAAGVVSGRAEIYTNDLLFAVQVAQVFDLFVAAQTPLVNGGEFFRIFNTGVADQVLTPYFELVL